MFFYTQGHNESDFVWNMKSRQGWTHSAKWGTAVQLHYRELRQMTGLPVKSSVFTIDDIWDWSFEKKKVVNKREPIGKHFYFFPTLHSACALTKRTFTKGTISSFEHKRDSILNQQGFEFLNYQHLFLSHLLWTIILFLFNLKGQFSPPKNIFFPSPL